MEGNGEAGGFEGVEEVEEHGIKLVLNESFYVFRLDFGWCKKLNTL